MSAPHDSVEALVHEFVERRKKGEPLTAEQFLRERNADDPLVRSRLEAATTALDGAARSAERTQPLPGAERERTELAPESAAPGGTVILEGLDAQKEVIDGRYEVERLLGAGGFGRVYLVRDQFFKGKRLALKTILPEHSAKHEFASRFRTEIEVERRLQHPGIPQIHNDGRTPQGEFYYTMEFVSGVTLSDVLKKSGPLPPPRIVHIVRQLLAILDYAHEKGVVHRDLKPANIMLVDAGTPHEKVKVLDFGIAKILHEEDTAAVESQHTVAGMGTPHYMAPEQVRGDQIDGRTDVYALGIIIYQMCSGLLPFAGKTNLEIATARLEKPPQPLDIKDTPPWMRDLVMRLLERDQKRRPRTKEVQEQFERLAKGQREITRHLRWIAAGVLVLSLTVAYLVWDRDVEPGPRPSPAQTPVTLDAGGDPQRGESSTHKNSNPVREHGPPANAVSVVVAKSARIESPSEGTFTRQGQVRVRVGTTNLARARVVVTPADDPDPSHASTRDEAPDARGGLDLTLDLAPGAWLIGVHDPGAEPGARALDVVRIVVDTTPPAIEVQARGVVGTSHLTREDHVVLFGRVTDAAPGELESFEIEGRSVPLARDGVFEQRMDLASDGPAAFACTAVDRAGNRTKSPVSVVRARAEPRVEIDAPAALRVEGLVGSAFTIAGRVMGPAGSTLVVDGVTQPLGEDARFRIPGEFVAGERRIAIQARDVFERTSQPVQVIATGVTAAAAPPAPIDAPRAPEGTTIVPGSKIDPSTQLPQRILHTRTGIELVLAPPGDARIGARAIHVSQPYYVGIEEVTRAQFARVAALPPDDSAATQDPGLPVTRVTFAEARQFCALAGLALPTHDEWLFAAAGTSGDVYPWGPELAATLADCNCVKGRLERPRSRPRDQSRLGVFDVAGNVTEWVEDGSGGAGQRGGSFSSSAEKCKLDFPRTENNPDRRPDSVGLRVVLRVPSK